MDVKRSDSSTSAGKSRIPISQRDSVGALHAPVSARSSTSAKSALSFGNVDSNWSDEDSLFSSANNPKQKKPGLLKLGSTPQSKGDDPKTEPTSEWSDDESHPIGGNKAEKDRNAIPPTPRGSQKNQGAVSESGTSAKKNVCSCFNQEFILSLPANDNNFYLIGSQSFFIRSCLIPVTILQNCCKV